MNQNRINFDNAATSSATRRDFLKTSATSLAALQMWQAIPVCDEKTLAESFGFKSFHAHDAELLDLVDSHANSILAVLSGHLHLTGYAMRKGVHHISISGTASYPSDYARFAVYDNKIEMNVHQLPKDLSAAAPSIHGKTRHGHDFTDDTHPTADEYQRGRPDERQLTIPRKRVA